MSSVKVSMKDTVDELGERVSRAADWREQVRAHPGASLAVAAIAGLLIGRQLAAVLGAGGVAALGASAALRGVPSNNGAGRLFADRIVNGVGSTLATAVLVPVVSGIQKFIESGRSARREAGR